MRGSTERARRNRPLRGDERGFALVLTLGVLLVVAALGVGLGAALESGTSGAQRAVDRAATYYLAEGIVDRAIAEQLASDTDWSDVADTLYRDVPLDEGICTVVSSNRAAQALDLTVHARRRRVVGTLRFRLERNGTEYDWRPVAAPFVEMKED